MSRLPARAALNCDQNQQVAIPGVELLDHLDDMCQPTLSVNSRVDPDERIACDYVRCGAVTLADRPSHLAELDRERRALREVAGHETRLLGATEVRAEIGSARFHGGLLDPAAGSVHPARYCAGLARAAEKAGALLVAAKK